MPHGVYRYTQVEVGDVETVLRRALASAWLPVARRGAGRPAVPAVDTKSKQEVVRRVLCCRPCPWLHHLPHSRRPRCC